MSDLKEKLVEAGKKAEEKKSERTKRAVKGAHLHEQTLKLVKESGLELKENSAFYQVQGAQKSVKLYIALKGGRIDLSGFTVQHAAVTQISEEEAKEKHIGKVRGQIDFDKSDAEVLEAFSLALEAAKVPAPPEAVKEEKPKREKKVVVEVASSAPESNEPAPVGTVQVAGSEDASTPVHA